MLPSPWYDVVAPAEKMARWIERAGAARVLVNRSVRDAASVFAFLAEFYELWNPRAFDTGLSAAGALRKAQEMIRQREGWDHPYYWAGWTLWGPAD